MIYLLFACFCVFFAWCWVRIRQVDTHDSVLFPFCQLRRDMLRFLHEYVVENPGTLSREEYTSVRKLLDVVSGTIHHYNRHKTVMFNIREMAKYLKQYRRRLKKIAPPELTDNADIQEFHARFVLCLAKAFLAYTPLIRWELVSKLVVLAYRFRYRVVSHRLRTYVLEGAKHVRHAVQDEPIGRVTA